MERLQETDLERLQESEGALDSNIHTHTMTKKKLYKNKRKSIFRVVDTVFFHIWFYIFFYKKQNSVLGHRTQKKMIIGTIYE